MYALADNFRSDCTTATPSNTQRTLSELSCVNAIVQFCRIIDNDGNVGSILLFELSFGQLF
jgi:hypothetical protein